MWTDPSHTHTHTPANKHMQRYTPLVIREINASWSHTKIHNIAGSRMAKILKIHNTKYWWERKQMYFSCTVSRSIMVRSLWKSLTVSDKVRHGLLCDPILLILERWEHMAYTRTYTWMLIWPFHNSQIYRYRNWNRIIHKGNRLPLWGYSHRCLEARWSGGKAMEKILTVQLEQSSSTFSTHICACRIQ